MNTQIEHTSGPWHRTGGMVDGYQIVNKYGNVVLSDNQTYCGLHNKANADFICKACNAYEDLLEALKYVVSYHREHDSGEGELYGLDYVTTCIAAIAKAEGK